MKKLGFIALVIILSGFAAVLGFLAAVAPYYDVIHPIFAPTP